jgi:DNA (cytosine-5)-methyltransferase 1
MIKIIDIFAGPGGLSEGFSAVLDNAGKAAFDVALSIEKDAIACETLRLRSFYRQLGPNVPDQYFHHIRGEINRKSLYEAYPQQADASLAHCWNTTLGPGGEPPQNVHQRISKSIGKLTDWVLIGGPPCQAYSIAGRSRNQGNPDYDPAKDVRQHLYVEYLQILAEHRPAVFVMENVKGLLSATLGKDRMFHRILDDLRDPARAVKREGRGVKLVRKGKYRIYSLNENRVFENGNLHGAVIATEHHGVPQARHRVILLGIRDDIDSVSPKPLSRQPLVTASKVLDGLPRLRSGLSPASGDSAQAWKSCLNGEVASRWVNAGTRKADSEQLSNIIRQNLREIVVPHSDRGGEFVKHETSCEYNSKWYCDDRIGGVCNHGSRSHMKSDLFRYMYASSYAALHKVTPHLRKFPTDLLPDHLNVEDAIKDGHFSDRFRVQVASRPSSTIVSHISKDGHYYIHPDPLQCRSLKVREAARLHTFPDNYFFCGPRTAKYIFTGSP